MVLLSVALGLAAGDVVAGAVAAVALCALAVRWGSTSLDAVAGAQAVLGPGGFVGSAGAMLSAWCGGAAVAVIAPARWPAAAFGAAAALSVAGPGPGSVEDMAVRLAGTAAGVAVALVAGRRLPRRAAMVTSVVLASAALALALGVAA